MKKLQFAFATLLILLFALFSCNDPSLIGSDLLSEDQLGVDFTDTLTIKAKTVYGDTVKTYANLDAQFSGDVPVSSFLFGEMEDPLFGKYSSQLYFQFELNGGLAPDFRGVLDSVILVLPYDTLGGYGNIEGTEFTAQLRTTNHGFDNTADYYSNDEISVSDFIDPTVTFTPYFPDSTIIRVPSGSSFEERNVPAQARIRLSDFFSNKLFTADSTNYESDAKLWEFVEGICVKPLTTTEGMVAFQPQNGGIEVYYHDDTLNLSYFFPVDFQSVRMTTFEHDYSGTIVEEYEAGGVERGDSLLFIQGMEGLDIEIEIPYADFRQDIVVNKAELILPLTTLTEDDPNIFTPLDQMLIGEVLDDGERVVVSDVQLLLLNGASAANLADNFGGVLIEDSYYSLNITDHFQNMINGSSTKTLRITPLERGNRASRSVIAGPKHGDIPMKLNLTYTILD